MVEWAQFNAKNENKESKAFEEMVYLLFCTKYGKKEGIFGYFNQRGIEKEPIKINDECIGFQAKFYRTKLSEHTSELINSIKCAKNDYPNITKIEFYINVEYGQGRKKGTNKPDEQINFENIINNNNSIKKIIDEIMYLEDELDFLT